LVVVELNTTNRPSPEMLGLKPPLSAGAALGETDTSCVRPARMSRTWTR